MRFGDLPPWALELSRIVRENILFSAGFSESGDLENEEECLFPSELLWREPLFNQLIVNIYQPGEVRFSPLDYMIFCVHNVCPVVYHLFMAYYFLDDWLSLSDSLKPSLLIILEL